MSRLQSSHPHPILPKPPSADMYGSSSGVGYPSGVSDNVPGQEFSSTRMGDQQLHQAPGLPQTSASYGSINSAMGRVGASAEMIGRYGNVPGAYQRSNPSRFSGARHPGHAASPNITLGSPMQSVSDGKYYLITVKTRV